MVGRDGAGARARVLRPVRAGGSGGSGNGLRGGGGPAERRRFIHLRPVTELAAGRGRQGAVAERHDEGPETDQRAVAAAFLAIVEMLAADAPVLLAIDDLQWLDASSRAVLTFAARRIKGRVGVLSTERPEPGCPTAMSWLCVGAKNDTGRIRLGPLSFAGLHALISGRLGRSLPHPTMVRIAEVSQGNPFYALELARAVGSQSPTAEQELPRTLAELVRSRIGDLDNEVRDVLLAAACVTDPTVDLLAQAKGITATETVALLETAESKGIVGIEGNRVRFTHPLLARGVYTDARPSRRRKMHRALARVEALPEVKARHLALATTSEDPQPSRHWTLPRKARGRGVLRPRPPSWSTLRSASAVTRRSVGSARPDTISTQATTDTLTRSLSLVSESSSPAHC